MAWNWNSKRARSRIAAHIKTAPTVDTNVTLKAHKKIMKTEIAAARAAGRFPAARAVAVEGAHLYGQLLDFEDVAVDSKREETLASHKKVLEFLHLHYSVWDSIVDADDALRVDFHGPRIHVVITEPTGDTRGQVQRAVALAAKLQEAAKRVGQARGYPSRTRFGIDVGTCLALTTGRSHDADTLFLGSPANYAAKLAAGEEPGIFLTQRAEAIQSGVLPLLTAWVKATPATIASVSQTYRFTSIDRATGNVVEGVVRSPAFAFFRPDPPLKELHFEDLRPSHTARMGMASLFADIDGYTAFVDKAIVEGPEAIKEAVTAIHVLREELNDVLKSDFGGKRVRFIGDCIHGLLAEGEGRDDPPAAVATSALCASGMQSSFDLCEELVSGVSDLGLAIGIEYGPVPLTRIGKPGHESIRCAAGKAVIISERVQQSIEGSGVYLGDTARRVASAAVSKHYGQSHRILGFDDGANLLGAVASPVAATLRSEPTARSHLLSRS